MGQMSLAMLQPSLKCINQLFEHAVTSEPIGLGSIWQIRDFSPMPGGDTHSSYLLHSDGPSFLLKLNDLAKQGLFSAEAHGLHAIAATQTIATCRPLCLGHCQNYSYLVLEGLNLEAQGNWYLAGQQLARMHLSPVQESYGFNHPSYCGKTYQPSTRDDNWAHFFAVHRIGHQLSLLRGKHIDDPEIQTMVDIVKDLLHHRQPPASLVHGDLWQGNIGFHQDQPVIFDPACYYGDPETDLAMSELFSRLPEDFYRGYESISAIDSGYSERRDIYQLYHLLNHANLFGGSYRQDAERSLRKLLH